jgi:heme-degrading monooxygenase HmoA
MRIRRLTVVLVPVLVLAGSTHVRTQTPSVEDLMATGLRQLADARTTGTEPAYQAVDETIARVLDQQPNHPRALMARGELRFLRARRLVIQGQIASSVTLFQSGIVDMGRAVNAAPDRLDLRVIRGLAYGPFPTLYNLTPIVRGDLETAVRHPDFDTLPVEQRVRIWLQLGSALVSATQNDQAVDAFRRAVALDSQSRAGKEARDRMNALLAHTPYRPDRFPDVGADASPLLVVVSFTRRSAASDGTQALMKETMNGLERMPGLLGQALATTVDAPGMFLLFTWWKDKQAVNDFYYSDFHQRLAGARGQAITNGTTFQADQTPTQLGIEVLTLLPGGLQMGGGFVPRDHFQRMQRARGEAR